MVEWCWMQLFAVPIEGFVDGPLHSPNQICILLLLLYFIVAHSTLPNACFSIPISFHPHPPPSPTIILCAILSGACWLCVTCFPPTIRPIRGRSFRSPPRIFSFYCFCRYCWMPSCLLPLLAYRIFRTWRRSLYVPGLDFPGLSG